MGFEDKNKQIDFSGLRRETLKENVSNIEKKHQRSNTVAGRKGIVYDPATVADDAFDFDSVFGW